MQEYIKVDEYLHWLSQIIAKINKACVPEKEDDSHTNLFYDHLSGKIIGRWIHTERGQIVFAFNLNKFEFECLNESLQAICSFSLQSKTIQEIEKEIANFIEDLSLKTDGITEKLHYEIPNYTFSLSKIKALDNFELSEWRYYRNLANQVSTLLLGHLQKGGEVRIWPHHFDTGVYVSVNDRIGIGFGLAMKDSVMDSPYFYTAAYLKEGKLDYKDLPSFRKGYWSIREDWQGAVLKLSEIKDLSFGERENAINDHLSNALLWFIDHSDVE